jgi:mono/diheme cytochrome c family protein
MMNLGLRSTIALALLVALGYPFPGHAEEATRKPFDVKNAFRNICGFCHEDYGRKAAKGPQLMHSERSDEFLINRIKNGMPGRMAAFGSVFTDDQIRDIVRFIRSLKQGEEPRNPS